mmetsp:Transcript_59484/g.146105  ORF Transcript_59484/g.146105 Transcript_59484/m.146105 type:complete len:214 (-) Transcript_59484:65-706(-)
MLRSSSSLVLYSVDSTYSLPAGVCPAGGPSVLFLQAARSRRSSRALSLGDGTSGPRDSRMARSLGERSGHTARRRVVSLGERWAVVHPSCWRRAALSSTRARMMRCPACTMRLRMSTCPRRRCASCEAVKRDSFCRSTLHSSSLTRSSPLRAIVWNSLTHRASTRIVLSRRASLLGSASAGESASWPLGKASGWDLDMVHLRRSAVSCRVPSM